jgi:acyl-CoA synthetase (AMP-forming)/AMP-acid ligase II
MMASELGVTLCDLLLRARGAGRWLNLPSEPRSSDRADRMDFGAVLRRSRRRARALRARGAQPGRCCVLVFDNDAEFVISFFAAQWVGMVCVPFHPPNFTLRERAYTERLDGVARHCDAQFTLTTRTIAAKMAHDTAPSTLLAVEELEAAAVSARERLAAFPITAPDDVAVIQYTSGSTGAPKAVELTHAAIAANVDAIGRAVAVSRRDILLCWLPMFHDMGLFGSLIFSLYWRIPIVLLSPRTFLLRPESWLWAMSRFSATLCPAPNFAYHMCVGRIRDPAIAGLDLRSWRVAFNGSESVQHGTVSAFIERFAPYGFAPAAMYPVYGLAENVVAASFPRCGEGASFDWIDRSALADVGLAVPLRADDPRALAVACVGRPLAGQRVRITRNGAAARDRELGEIELQGPTLMRGYHRDDVSTRRAITPDGWLRSFDLGYLAEGQLHVVGRSKNVIKRGGESYQAEVIEAELAQLPGVDAGYLSICGCASERTGTEELVVLLEVRGRDRTAVAKVQRAIAQRCHDRFGVTPDRILLLRPGTLPRTTSGKVRRSICKEMLKHGELDEHITCDGVQPRSDPGEAARDPGVADAGPRLDGERHPA